MNSVAQYLSKNAREYGIWIALVLIVILFQILTSGLLLIPNNVASLIQQNAYVMILAMGMVMVIVAGHIDLSVGSIVAFSGLLCATVISGSGSIALGIGASLVAGAFIGAVNGVIIAKVKINALITTLAMMEIVRGLGFIVSGGQAIGISNEAFFALGNTMLLGIPVPVLVTVVCFVVFGVALNKTTYGRNILAIGGNPDAARLAGVNVTRSRILVFLFQGLICALAGVILASRITSGQPNAAMGFELNVMSACVLGGVSLAGGRATISGVIVGVLIMGTVENAMNLLNIDAFYQYLVRGMILLAAVTVDQLKYRYSGL